MSPKDQMELLRKLYNEQGLKPPTAKSGFSFTGASVSIDGGDPIPILSFPVMSTLGSIAQTCTNATTNTSSSFTVARIRLMGAIFKTLDQLPLGLATLRLAELLTIQGMCFERSVNALAAYHGLPRTKGVHKCYV